MKISLISKITIIFTFTLFIQPSWSQNNFFDPIYHHTEKIFWQNLNNTSNNASKIQHFNQQKLSLQFQELAKNALRTSTYCLFFIYLPVKYKNKLPSSNTMQNLLIISGLHYSSLMHWLISGFQQNINHIATNVKKIIFAHHDNMDHVEIRYVLQKEFMPIKMQNLIEQKIKSIRIYDKQNNQFATVHSDPSTTIKLVDTILSLPLHSKPINTSHTQIKKYLHGYSADILGKLTNFIVRQVAASRGQSFNKIAAYFKGAPGTGKTRAAQIIAAILNLPMISISPDQLNAATLIGSQQMPGILTQALLQAKKQFNHDYKNILLVFDDGDRLLNSGLINSAILKLFDPDTTSYYDDYLEVYIDISHIAIIITGNSAILDPALKNRLEIVDFGNYSTQYKQWVVWNDFIPKALEFYNKGSKETCKVKDFSQEEIEQINHLIQKDTDPGFRSIKLAVQNLIEEKFILQQANILPQ